MFYVKGLRIISDKVYLGLDEVENNSIVSSRIVCFNNDGSTDSNFGNSGVLVISNSDFPDAFLFNFLVDKNNEIYVLGNYYSNNFSQYLIMKYNVSGILDSGFGTVTLPVETYGAYIADMHFSSDEYIYISWENGSGEIRTVRLPKSSPNSYSHNLISGYHFGSMEILQGGMFYLTAAKTNVLESYLFRMDSTLSFDNNFGSNGIATIPNLSGYEPYRLDYISVGSTGGLFLSGSGNMPGNPTRAITTKLFGNISPPLQEAEFHIQSKNIKLTGVESDSTSFEILVTAKSETASISSFNLTISGFSDSLKYSEAINYIPYSGWNLQYSYSNDTLRISGEAAGSPIPPGTTASNLFSMVLKASNGISAGIYTVKFEDGSFNNGSRKPKFFDGEITIIPSNISDVDRNGNIQAYDASLILRYLVNDVSLSSEQLIFADASGD